MSQSSQAIKAYLAEVSATLAKLPVDTMEQIVRVLKEARTRRKQIFLFGNGGSAATASHLVSDFAKGAIRPGKPRFRAISLTDNLPLLSAWANDASYEDIFAQQLENQVEPGDVVIGISGSGKSLNVLNALRLARSAGAVTIGLTGFDGGELKNLVDLCIIVPSNSMEQVEDIHLLLGHVITTCLRTEP
ncbi:MAG TPA: SIS domain-containing protein [Dehalococcoidia bacterium]|nr:SIS domain-containing protein [Dehalococcoidia bacterium]